MVLDNIREVILATDIKTHFTRIDKVKQMVAGERIRRELARQL